MSNGDFEGIQRYHFRNFLVNIYSFLGENGKKKFAANINNNKWQTSVYSSGNTPEGSRKLPRYIVLYDESEENLRDRVSSLLKEPDLEKGLIEYLDLGAASSKWNHLVTRHLGIEVNSLVPPGADFESIYGEEPYDESPYNDNKPLDDYDYDSVDDTHSMEWNEVEEEWSNESDYS